ncbi:MAG: hypothetical protein Q9223_004790, partial [Gallowayella weberi]
MNRCNGLPHADRTLVTHIINLALTSTLHPRIALALGNLPHTDNFRTQAATVLIKPATAQSAAHPPATIVAKKVTSAVNAVHLKRRSRATVVVKPAISHVNVATPPEELPQEAWAVGTLAALADKNAINAE